MAHAHNSEKTRYWRHGKFLLMEFMVAPADLKGAVCVFLLRHFLPLHSIKHQLLSVLLPLICYQLSQKTNTGQHRLSDGEPLPSLHLVKRMNASCEVNFTAPIKLLNHNVAVAPAECNTCSCVIRTRPLEALAVPIIRLL
eukprot:scaffold5848_cov18-Prasinocladus_malaysianus.AAC.1